jgi:phage shock protein A
VPAVETKQGLAARVAALLARWRSPPVPQRDLLTAEKVERAAETAKQMVTRTAGRLSQLEEEFNRRARNVVLPSGPDRGRAAPGSFDEALSQASAAFERQIRAVREAPRDVAKRSLGQQEAVRMMSKVASELEAREDSWLKEVERERQQSKEWQRCAEAAVLSNDDDLALEALARAREHEWRADSYARAAKRDAELLADARTHLDALSREAD